MTCTGCFEGSTFDALARQLRRRGQQPSQLLSSVIKRRMLSRRNSETQETPRSDGFLDYASASPKVLSL